jgi:hypothetical protein
MVLRRDAAGVLAVGQAAHAWLCGQFARAWGNERFGAVEPLDDVALGAEQHDLGMAVWDLDPERNPETGLPVSFMEMAPELNAELWRQGPPGLISQSRYAALLATMHGRRLWERRDLATLGDAAAAIVRALLQESAARERSLAAALQADPAAAPVAGPDSIARNSALVWTWDLLSLALLLDWAPHTLESVPVAGGGAVDVELRAVARREGLVTLSLSPWPFADPAGVVVHTEGRRLTGPSESSAQLAASLAAASWETVRFALVPAAPGR